MEKRFIYLLLTDTGTLFTKSIKYFSNESYVHASISLDNSLTEMYSFGRLKPRNPFIGGFVVEDKSAGLFAIKKETRCQLYRIPISDEKLNCLKERLLPFIAESNKFKYNLLGVLTFNFNTPLKWGKEKYFCTEFVGDLLVKSKILQTSKPIGLISAKDLRKVENAELIYEGKLCDYLPESESKSALVNDMVMAVD